MKHSSLACALTLLGTLAGAARADVLVVSPTSIYTDIQQAVDAALDDDVILVKSGTYPSFVIRNKALVVAEDTGHTVRIDGAIRVGGINGARTVVLIGLENVGGVVTSVSGQYGLRVTNSSGLVLAQDCILRSSTRATAYNDIITEPRPALLTENALAVVLSRCEVRGSDSILGSSRLYPIDLYYSSGVPSEGAYIRDSGVSFFECTVVGGRGRASQDGSPGAHGIWGIASAVYLSASGVTGGHGADGHCVSGIYGNGGRGGDGLLAMQGTAVELLGTVLQPGLGGTRSTLCGIGGGGTDGAPGLPLRLLGTSTAITLPGVPKRLDSTALVREGQTAQLSFSGADLGEVVDRYSSRIGTAYYDPVLQSIQVPNFAPSFRVSRVGIAGPGILLQQVPIPELGPGVAHRLIHYQGAHTTPLGLRLGTPRAVLMLDAAF